LRSPERTETFDVNIREEDEKGKPRLTVSFRLFHVAIMNAMDSTENDDVLYVLDPAKVLQGDIVLTTGDRWTSWTIRTVTRSPFSHAAICTRPDMLIEAQPTGITRALVSMTCSPTIGSLAVLRLKPGLSNVDTFGLSVADYAESFYGRAYSVKGALASPLPVKGPDSGSALFCSQLVVEAYRSVGVDLLPGVEPNKVVPGALINSVALSNVTDSAVRVVRRKDSELEYLTLLDGPAMGVPHDEMKMNRRVADRIRREMVRLNLTQADTLPHALWVLENLAGSGDSALAAELDHCCLQAFEAECFVDWYIDQDASLRASVEDLMKVKEFVERNQVPREQRLETARVLRLAIGERDSGDMRRATFEETQKRATSTSLKTFAVLADLYHRQWQTERHRRAVIQQVITALEA